MESVYNLLDELDVSADYLYKQHTGHRIFNDGCDQSSESSDGSDDSDSENKPPLFTHEEIMANLSYCNSSIVASADSTQHTPETIATKLHQYITDNQCFICNEYDKKHYRQTSHFKCVRAWIDGQLRQVKQPVDWELIFCQACNQPLTGNEAGNAHYSESLHRVKASSFCTPCLRVIDSHNMVSHCMSKQHIHNEAMTKAAIKSKEESNRGYWEETVSKTKYRGPTVQTTFPQIDLPGELSYASVLRCTDAKPEAVVNSKGEFELKSKLFNSLSVLFDNVSVGPKISDARSKKDKKREITSTPSTKPSIIVESYTEPSFNNMPYDNCYKLGAKAVVSKETRIQYSDQNSNYYDVLMDSNSTDTSPEVDTRSSLNTEAPVEDPVITNNDQAFVGGVKKRRKRHKCKAGRYSEDISSVTDEVSESVEETHCETPKRDDRKSIKQNSAPLTFKEVHANMYRVLHWMMRWNYCHICNEPVRRQEKGNHYKQKGHIGNFKQFIETEGSHYGYNMMNIGAVFCLPCNTLFVTTKEAYDHYESDKHVRTFSNFCPICLTHGNCTIHKEFKQRMSDIFDKWFLGEIGQKNDSAPDKTDEDNGQKKIPNEDKFVESPINLNLEQKNVASAPDNIVSESPPGCFQQSPVLTDNKVTEELAKFNILLQTIPPEDRLSHLIRFNKVLTETAEQHAGQPKETPIIISDSTKCLNDVSHLNTILLDFLKSDPPILQKLLVPSLIMDIRNLKQSVEVMLQTGIDIPVKQVFDFSHINSPDTNNDLNVLKATLRNELRRLRSFVESQTTFESEKVTKLFHDFNETIIADLKLHRRASQVFDEYFYGKAPVSSTESGDNSSLVNSEVEDELLFESAVECSCPKLCDKSTQN